MQQIRFPLGSAPHFAGGGLTTVFKELTSKGSIGKEEGRGRGGKGQGKEK